MKTLKLVFVIIASAVVMTGVGVLPQRLCFEGGSGYTFYCGTSSQDCKVVKADKSPKTAKIFLKNICGESCEYQKLDIESFLKQYDGEILFKEELSDSVNYYCRADLPYFVELRGERINLHICVRDDTAIVASPIIFGGY